MHPLLQKNEFYLKGNIGLTGPDGNIDIFEQAGSRKLLMASREQKRFFSLKKHLILFHDNGEKLLSVKKNRKFFSLIHFYEIHIHDEFNQYAGKIQVNTSLKKWLVLYNNQNQPFCKASYRNNYISFLDTSSRLLAGITQEKRGFIASLAAINRGSNYFLKITDTVHSEDEKRMVILAASLWIDIWFEEFMTY